MKRSAFNAPISSLMKGLYRGTARSLCRAVMVLGIATAITFPAMAQTATTQTAARQFDIPAGALGSALLRFGEQSGLQFSIGSELTRGKRTAGIKGKFTPEDGLRALLGGTGLTFRFTGPRTVVVEPLPDTGEARVLGPLRVEGADNGRTFGGINGSTDGTATENSGTYGATATSIVSKSVQSVLDTPQSVSVLTRQQLSDQNINDFNTAVGQLPGLTLRPGGNNLSFEYMSRGFYVNKIRIDGGGPITTDYDFRPSFDMALYDHIEVLRGADGMYSGYGNPGGVINLVRKRPLDHPQVLVEGEVGSWNNYRTMVDVTGPLGFDGRLRGRAVFTYQDRDYFYDTAFDKHTAVYGVLEADVTPDLMMRAGFSLTDHSALPWGNGLPRFESGADLGLPRDTCLCFADSYDELTSKELFLQAEYQINPDWALDTKLTHFDQEIDNFYLFAFGGVKPDTGLGFGSAYSTWSGRDANPIRNSADVALKGSFDLFGKRQNITFGGNYADSYSLIHLYNAYTYGGAAYLGFIPNIPAGSGGYGIDVLDFDPNDTNYRPLQKRLDSYYDEGVKEYTIYANWNAQLTDKLQLNLGFRYSYFGTHQESNAFCNPYPGQADPTSCDVYGQDADGNWIVVDTIGVGEPYSFSPKVMRNVDRSFAWPPSWSLVYTLNDNFSLYGSYSDTFESQASNVDTDFNPLPPVTGFNAEIGSNFLSDDGKLSGKASLYYIKKDGFAVLVYDDPDYGQSHPGSSCCYIGGDDTKQKSYGLDLELAGELTPSWQISASYSLNFNKNEINTESFQGRYPLTTYSPKHMLKLWTNYKPMEGAEWLRKLSFGGGVNMQTRTLDTGEICTNYEYGDPDPITGIPVATCTAFGSYEFTQGFYSVWSARAAYQLNQNWNIALNINNVFDKEYYSKTSPPFYGNWYGDPRNFTLSVSGKF